ncbi:cytochrome c biogenesis heme-transporting ATPase CcmA [Duganella aquatilis]|nr:cytochrome c biogenesis heme-transporting ATPase CcmA [Duganella aquatilis]
MSLQACQLACMRGGRSLFHGLDFTLEAGDALRVSGANGSGKSSLLRLLCGLSFPSAGEVRWQGRDIRSAREEYGAALLYLGHANGVKDDLLAWENVVVASTLAGRPVSRAQACAALSALGLGPQAHLPTLALSQGQRKRVALARLHLQQEARLWILDEPFAALDTATIAALTVTLERHLAQGGALVYTTHQPVALRAPRMRTLDLSMGAAC